MPWSYANIDWNGTGAMVQAIGSVAAILAAIWIDQGTVRRQERARRQEESSADRDRLAAIRQCETALRVASLHIGRIAFARARLTRCPVSDRREVQAAAGAVSYYLRSPQRVGPGLIGSLALTSQIMEEVEFGTFSDVQSRDAFAAKLDAVANGVKEILEDYVNGLL